MGFFIKNFWLKVWLFIFASACALLWHRLQANGYAQTKVVYSLEGKPDQEIINLIQHSNEYVYFAVYTLTRSNLSSALVAAKLRGIQVEGILDGSQSTISQEKTVIAQLQKYQIPLEIPEKSDGSLMHAKFVVTDAGYASGSYNWTTSATSYNDEVLEIGAVQGIKDQYLKIFRELWEKYQK